MSDRTKLKKRDDTTLSLNSEISKDGILGMTTKVIHKYPWAEEARKKRENLGDALKNYKELLGVKNFKHKKDSSSSFSASAETLGKQKEEDDLRRYAKRKVGDLYLPPDYTSLMRTFSAILTCLQLHWSMYKEAMWYRTLKEMLKERSDVIFSKRKLGNIKAVFPTAFIFAILRLYCLNYLKIDVLDRKVPNGTGLTIRPAEEYLIDGERAEQKLKELLTQHLRRCVDEVKSTSGPQELINGIPREFNYETMAKLPYCDVMKELEANSSDQIFQKRKGKTITRKQKRNELLESLRGIDASRPDNIDKDTGISKLLWLERGEQQIVKINSNGIISRPFSRL